MKPMADAGGRVCRRLQGPFEISGHEVVVRMKRAADMRPLQEIFRTAVEERNISGSSGLHCVMKKR
jgi:hypothetical protein